MFIKMQTFPKHESSPQSTPGTHTHTHRPSNVPHLAHLAVYLAHPSMSVCTDQPHVFNDYVGFFFPFRDDAIIYLSNPLLTDRRVVPS